jgi:predicted DNA-binding protein with PD1-like motif
MKILYSSPTQDLLVFYKGDDVVSTLLEYCDRNNIQSAWFQGLGAGSDIEFSYYDFKTKEYVKKQLHEDFEINNVTGNVAVLDGKLVTHFHISISNHELNGFGGHVFSLKISGTLELMVTKLPVELKREFDEETGLNLLKTAL